MTERAPDTASPAPGGRHEPLPGDSASSAPGGPHEPLPFVSVIMPVRNEARFIERSLGAVLRQDYPPERMEIIVVDGMSDDGTREALARVVETTERVRVLDNPDRIVPSALNAGIRAARGEIIIRVDGHCEIAPDFVRQDVALLREHPEAWSVGGPTVHAAHSTFGRAAAAAMSHPLGIGNASHRFRDFEGYGEGAAFPAIRRTVFDRIGLFDERFVRNQDDEFNYRMRQAGGKIFISPRVEYVYFVRERVRRLFKQYFQYGFWRIPCIRKHRRPFNFRQLVPSLFFTMVLTLAVAGALTGKLFVALLLPMIYLLALAGAALSIVPREGLAVAARMPLAMLALHTGYGFGLLFGLFAMTSSGLARTSRRRMSTISR